MAWHLRTNDGNGRTEVSGGSTLGGTSSSDPFLNKRGFITATTPEKYDRWYYTPRGQWIGQLEYRLLRNHLRPHPEETILDVGCGTGYFTRCFACDQKGTVVGVDHDPTVIEYASFHAANRETYLVARGETLPFPSRSFDLSISITALCFVKDQVQFLQEMARVTRRCLAIGLLNHRSLLWRREGREDGRGSYCGAHWHTRQEVIEILSKANLSPIFIGTALHFPSGNRSARFLEKILPACWPWGGFLLVTCDLDGRENNSND
jgi:SAM-dependent methyltransferase